MASILEEIRGKIDTLVENWREAFSKNDLSGCHANEALITEQLKDYKKQSLNCAMFALKQQDDPMRAAVTQVTYDTLRFKHDRVEGIEVGAHIEPSTERFDLVQVAKFCGKPTDFQYDIDKLSQLFAVRVVEDLNMELDDRKAAEVARVRAKYRIGDKARAIEDGPNPTSNTQLIARIQAIVDKVFPGGGLKVVSRDLSFVMHGFTKVSREIGTVDIGQSKLMRRLFVDMMNRKVTGTNYVAAFKETKEKAEAKQTATVVVKDEAAEAPAQTKPTAKRGKKSGQKAA